MDRMKNLRINKGNSIKNLRWAVMVLLAALLVTPALADPGLYTGCLDTKKGTLYNIQSGSEPLKTCAKGDTVLSLYDNTTVDALRTQVTDLQAEVTNIKNLLNNVTRSGNDIYITGANLHVRSGSGATDGQINGLGNLIIGYNELRGSGDDRTGSHNLILGTENNYMSYGGLVAGDINEISGPYASVSGGIGNRASGGSSSVSGGFDNRASSLYSSVSGGVGNRASGGESSVSGGIDNRASGLASSVSGGINNTASGDVSSVSGGANNTASGADSSVSGGFTRSVFNQFDWRAGGLFQEQ